MTRACIFCLVPLLAALGACGGGEWEYRIDGKWYKVADYLAATKAEQERVLALVERRATPLAGPAVVVIPTREYVAGRPAAMIATSYEGACRSSILTGHFTFTLECIGQDWGAPILEADDLAYAYVPRLIERRNIFAMVEIVRADRPDGIDTPPGGYLLWLEPKPRNYTLHMRAAGELGMSQVVSEAMMDGLFELYSVKSDAPGLVSAFLWYIEDFVRTHQPSA